MQDGDRPASKILNGASVMIDQDIFDPFCLLRCGCIDVENGVSTQGLLDVDQHMSIFVRCDGLKDVSNT